MNSTQSTTTHNKIGSMFIKYKHKKGKDRMVWCPINLDRILWGDETKKNVKGYLMISDIQRISDGMLYLII